MKKLLLTIPLFVHFTVNAASVDTVSIYSQSMHRSFRCVVILPDSYKKKGRTLRYPTVYLLHGWSGAYNNWINRVPQLREHADNFQLMIVCPEGGFSSWYLDSPVDSTMKHETYVAVEVPAYIDAHFRSIKNRKARAITGLSMGGHGALLIALHHPGFFGACGSMSGLVDLNSSVNKYDLIKRLGDTATHADNWEKYSIINLVENYPKDSLAMMIDCGTEDGFFSINHLLHEKMLQLKIPHDYVERPGKHDWAYWKNAVQYQLLFFRNYFERIKN